MTRVTHIESLPSFRAAIALFRLDRARRTAEARSELGVATQRLMWLFRDGQARTLKDVAETLGLEQSTVNRQVNAALDADLLRRYRDPGQSAHLLEATENGITRFEEELRWGLELVDTALDAVPPADRTAFLEHLLRFADAYDTAAHGS